MQTADSSFFLSNVDKGLKNGWHNQQHYVTVHGIPVSSVLGTVVCVSGCV